MWFSQRQTTICLVKKRKIYNRVLNLQILCMQMNESPNFILICLQDSLLRFVLLSNVKEKNYNTSDKKGK